MTYHIVAYPAGVRTIVAAIHARGDEDAIERAKVHARLRGEYVDMYRDDRPIGVCDGAGIVTGYETHFRYE